MSRYILLYTDCINPITEHYVYRMGEYIDLPEYLEHLSDDELLTFGPEGKMIKAAESTLPHYIIGRITSSMIV